MYVCCSTRCTRCKSAKACRDCVVCGHACMARAHPSSEKCINRLTQELVVTSQTSLACGAHITKYVLHTSKINDTLNYHEICLAICVYLRKAKLATSLISPRV